MRNEWLRREGVSERPKEKEKIKEKIIIFYFFLGGWWGGGEMV